MYVYMYLTHYDTINRQLFRKLHVDNIDIKIQKHILNIVVSRYCKLRQTTLIFLMLLTYVTYFLKVHQGFA